jgi:RNA polymerase sigma-70 factor (ECF subfamily)
MAHPDLKLPPPFDELLRLHEHEIMRLCLRLTADRQDALDLFQDIWLRAYRAYPRLSAAPNARAWLFTIATNRDRNRRRDRMRRDRIFAPEPIGDHRAAAANDPAALATHLRRSIERLPDHQRRAFVMRKLGGLNYEEIGTALDCSPAAARAHVFVALKKIKAGWPS